MKKFKKVILLLSVSAMCVSPAFAQTSSTSMNQQVKNVPIVSVFEGHSSQLEETSEKLIDDMFSVNALALKEFDLSTGDYSADAEYSSSVTIQRLFAKHGGTIKVKITNVDTDRDHTVTVKLFKDGVEQQKTTLSIGMKKLGIFNNKTATFKNLDADSKYTIKLENGTGSTYNEQVKVTN